MALSTISFGTTFDLSQSTKVFLFTDYTNYAGQGINPADCKCVLEVTAPGGAIWYQNTNFNSPDINPSVSPLNIIQIQVPLGSNGVPVPGQYTFKMTTQVNDGVNPVYTVSSQYNFTYEYVSPVVAINQTVNCVSPLFTSTDETVYTVNNVIPTISRSHNIYFPIGSGLPTATGTAQSITCGANQFANGTQTTEITTTLNYVMDSNVNIFDSVTGVLEIQVNCEWVCKITCCLTALNNRMESQRCSNYPAFLQTKDIFTQVMSKVTLIMQLISCGKENEVSAVIGQIQSLANCTDDCCGQDTPSLVGGLNGGGGSGANVIVTSGGPNITVTSSTVGDTTTYTVNLSSAFANIVNNSYNTVLAPGGGITWTDSGVINGVRTFTPNVSIAATNSLAFKINIDCSNGSTLLYSISDVKLNGSLFQAPTVDTWVPWASNSTENNGFVVNDFYVGAPSSSYKVTMTLIIDKLGKANYFGTDVFRIPPPSLLFITAFNQQANQFNFRFDSYGNTSIDLGTNLIFKELIQTYIKGEINVFITE